MHIQGLVVFLIELHLNYNEYGYNHAPKQKECGKV